MGGITTEELHLNPDSFIKTDSTGAMIYTFVHPETGKKVTFRVQTNPAGWFECVVTWVDVVSKEVYGNSDIDQARRTWDDVIRAGYVLKNSCKDWNMDEFHAKKRKEEWCVDNKDYNKWVKEFTKKYTTKENYALEA